jgi:hypothetical protein
MRTIINITLGCLLLSIMSFTNFDNIEECDLLTLSQLKSLYNMNYLDREDELLRLGFSFGGKTESRKESMMSFLTLLTMVTCLCFI